MLALNTYLGYPDDLLANNHRNANKLGLLDLTVEERTKLVMNDEEVDPYIKTNVRETRLIKCNSEVKIELIRPADAADTSCKMKTSVHATSPSKTS
jgi:hypothetical protein